MFPMKRSLAALLLLGSLPLFAQQPPKKSADPAKPAAVDADLSQYKTIKDAKTADPKTFKNVVVAKPSSPGYLGFEVLLYLLEPLVPSGRVGLMRVIAGSSW